MDKKYHFFLWIKKTCSFCIEAKDVLFDKDHKHTIYEMDSKPETLQQVKNRFNWQTVPLVLVQCSDGETKFIGGYDDLKDYLNNIIDENRIGYNEVNHD